jgi:hypothetical protein
VNGAVGKGGGCPVCRVLAREQRFSIHEQRAVLEREMIVNVEETGWSASKNEAHHEDPAVALRPAGWRTVDNKVKRRLYRQAKRTGGEAGGEEDGGGGCDWPMTESGQGSCCKRGADATSVRDFLSFSFSRPSAVLGPTFTSRVGRGGEREWVPEGIFQTPGRSRRRCASLPLALS